MLRFAILLLLALALRGWDFGNPVIHVDEQYYLLVGDRMLDGALPYVDIWDRKPIGLFLLFAGIRWLGGDGILAYQLVATLFAAAAAWLVATGARSIGAGERAALAAGAAYLIWLSLLGGRGGQTPVFYNLLMTAAAVLVIRLPLLAATARHPAIVASGVLSCLLAGIAIQMKYTPAVEGLFFGLAHLWFLRRAGPAPLAGAAAAMLAAGLAPTLGAIGGYAAAAQLDAWWFANITSIFARPGYPLDQLAMRLLGIVAQLMPLIICALLAARMTATVAQRLALIWLGFAIGGFLAIGTFFDHYALPLIAPLAVVASTAFQRWRAALIATLAFGSILFAAERSQIPDDGPGARAIAAVVRANIGDECPYVFIGDTITYLLADACLPTAHAFPNLLAYATEQGATGIDEAGEVRRILGKRPPVIVTSDRRLAIWNRASVLQLKAALARDYRPVFSAPRAGYRSIVYLRRDRAFKSGTR